MTWTPPSYIDRVNGIIDFWSNPCDAPMSVYMRTMLPPAGQATLTLLSFGLGDVLRGYFRPRALRSRRHGRRGTRRGLRVPGLPEVGNMIGSSLPGAEEAQARRTTQGTRTLWRIDGGLQRLLYYWLVADVVTEFLYDWASLIEQSGFCTDQKGGAASSAENVTIIPGSQRAIGNTSVLYAHGQYSAGSPVMDFTAPSLGRSYCHFSATAVANDPLQPISTRLGIQGPSGQHFTGDFTPPSGIEPREMVISGTGVGGGGFVPYIDVDGGFATITEAFAVIGA